MKLLVFSVYDSKVEAFLQPFFAPTKGAALRSFTDACNSGDHEFNRHAGDYTLFLIGSYDEKSSLLEPCTLENLGVALTFIVEESRANSDSNGPQILRGAEGADPAVAV